MRQKVRDVKTYITEALRPVLQRMVRCPLCGFLGVVTTIWGGLFGSPRDLSWSRVVCLRGHRSWTVGPGTIWKAPSGGTA